MKRTILAMLCGLIAGCGPMESDPTQPSPSDPIAFVKNMGAGWNLGNSLDAVGEDETAWGNPKTSPELIDAIAARGFKTIRIPVTWKNHMGSAPDYTIEEAWMNRVQEVVDYAVANDMYVILNTHHEAEWAIPTYEKVDEVTNRLDKVWTQIANHFQEYDNHLIFEPLNEPRLANSPEEWSGGTEEGRDCVNQFQQACVDAIRATGGKNSTRMIMVAPYGASSHPNAIEAFVVPNNDPNVLISIHNYFPVDLCLGDRKTWGTPEDINALKREFHYLHEQFIAKGRPIVLGEWGSTNNGNPEARRTHTQHYMREAIRHGICPVWWDNGGKDEFGLINRSTLEWYFPNIVETILQEATR